MHVYDTVNVVIFHWEKFFDCVSKILHMVEIFVI